ncbi:MAG: hypothetical protein JW982_11555 [Spirochaetes bacterium]|nr:hypothetical protein [Spirochaetota bacterium]
MSIASEINDQFKQNYEKEFSSELKSLLLNEDFIDKQLMNNEDPVELSIRKWDKIYHVFKIISDELFPYMYYGSFIKFIGYKTCALCISSSKKYAALRGEVKYQEDKCKVCPLAEIERCIDKDSTYLKIETGFSFKMRDVKMHSTESLQKQHEELDENILKMIFNLKKVK